MVPPLRSIEKVKRGIAASAELKAKRTAEKGSPVTARCAMLLCMAVAATDGVFGNRAGMFLKDVSARFKKNKNNKSV